MILQRKTLPVIQNDKKVDQAVKHERSRSRSKLYEINLSPGIKDEQSQDEVPAIGEANLN